MKRLPLLEKQNNNITRTVFRYDSSLGSYFSVCFLRHFYVTARDDTAETNFDSTLLLV